MRFWHDIRQRDAEEFAERPQDLVELCSDWREHHRIRSHREQVETNIATKLKPSTERKERAELSARDGDRGCQPTGAGRDADPQAHACGIASIPTAFTASEAALDVSKILQNWSAETGPRCWSARSSASRVMAASASIIGLWLNFSLRSGSMRCLRAASRSSRSSDSCSRKRHKAYERLGRRCARWRRGLRFRAIRFLTISLRSIRPLFLDHGDPQSLRPGATRQGARSVCGSVWSWRVAWPEHAAHSGAPLCIVRNSRNSVSGCGTRGSRIRKSAIFCCRLLPPESLADAPTLPTRSPWTGVERSASVASPSRRCWS